MDSFVPLFPVTMYNDRKFKELLVLAARDTKLERANFFEISSFWLILARFG